MRLNILKHAQKQSILNSTVFIAHQQSVTLLMGVLLLFFINDHVEIRFFSLR